MARFWLKKNGYPMGELVESDPQVWSFLLAPASQFKGRKLVNVDLGSGVLVLRVAEPTAKSAPPKRRKKAVKKVAVARKKRTRKTAGKTYVILLRKFNWSSYVVQGEAKTLAAARKKAVSIANRNIKVGQHATWKVTRDDKVVANGSVHKKPAHKKRTAKKRKKVGTKPAAKKRVSKKRSKKVGKKRGKKATSKSLAAEAKRAVAKARG